ncbi:MAG: MBL fold metallo-hydrolase [Oscillospiraceae bacterium]|jgi:phosphoribosyl 1,2-cyclic phosphodiesterase|nr:MBL fold metallo-hydrolase [Oscillospiraceae bacterium]
MSRFCPLFSSSKGNCCFVGTSGGGVLVDVGVSAKQLKAALNGIGVLPSAIGAIFLTHEHSDHVKGLAVFADTHGIPIYATYGTLNALQSGNHCPTQARLAVLPADGIEVNGLYVRNFATSHDVDEPCGYRFDAVDGHAIAVATDTGILTEETKDALLGCDLVMLESNHDVHMLKTGPYPMFLKRRILSDEGHLSNDACAAFLPYLLENGTTRFYLAHLSDHNNTPEIAMQTSLASFTSRGARQNHDFELRVAGLEKTMLTL